MSHPFLMHPLPPSTRHNLGVHEQSGNVVETSRTNQVGITNSKTVFVDSRTRVLGPSPGSSASDFTVIFERPYHNVTAVRLISAIIPIINQNEAAHGSSVIPYQPNTYVMLHVRPLGGAGGSFGSTMSSAHGDPANASAAGDASTRNFIADSDAIVAIPLNPNGPNIDVGGGVVVNFTHWEDKAEHDAVLRFKPMVPTLKGLEMRLYVWGDGATQGRLANNFYPLPNEVAPASVEAASGLKPINNVQYQFEVVSQS